VAHQVGLVESVKHLASKGTPHGARKFEIFQLQKQFRPNQTNGANIYVGVPAGELCHGLQLFCPVTNCIARPQRRRCQSQVLNGVNLNCDHDHACAIQGTRMIVHTEKTTALASAYAAPAQDSLYSTMAKTGAGS
jgi:hypothetical protein